MPSLQLYPRFRRLAQHVLLLAGLGLVFGLLGPFGTFSDLAAPVRFAYWYGLLLFGYLAIQLFAQALLPVTQAMRTPAVIALLTLTSALPTTLAVAWVESLVRIGRPIPPQVMPRVYASVAVIQLLMVLLIGTSRRRANPEHAAQAAPAAAPAAAPEPAREAAPVSPFLARIPAHLGKGLLAVTSEDHYLRIHTDLGSDLILMRIGDAIAELAVADGLQVHRSWWVKRDAVVAVRRNELDLLNGLTVPVSRSFLPAVRAMQWPRLASPTPGDCV